MDIVVGRKYVRTSLNKALNGRDTPFIFLGQIIAVTGMGHGAVFFKKPVRGSKEIRNGVTTEEDFLEEFKPLIQMEENE